MAVLIKGEEQVERNFELIENDTITLQALSTIAFSMMLDDSYGVDRVFKDLVKTIDALKKRIGSYIIITNND